MFCQKCGAEVPEGNPFCPSCGNPTQGVQPVQAGQAVQGATKKFDIKSPATIVSLAGIVLMAFSTFLPYISVEAFGFKMSVSFMDWDGRAFLGVILLVFVCVTALFLFLGVKVVYAIFAVICILVAAGEMWLIKRSLDSPSIGNLDGLIHYGAGRHLLILAIILLIVSIVLQFMKKK